MALPRKLFGPSREEIWRQLSADIGADFVDGGFCKSDKVQATHGEWIVTLDTYTVSTGKVTIVYTRMRAPYVNPDGFRFTVYRRGLFSDIARALGMQDVQVGHEPFDNDFVIKGTSGEKLRLLFASPRIRELIEKQPDIHFSVKDDEGWFGASFPDRVDELYFVVGGVIKDADRLKQLYALFSETLDQLCRIGAAYESPADVRL